MMAILRSRTIDTNPATIPNPEAARSIHQWHERLHQARAEGEAAARQALATEHEQVARRSKEVEAEIERRVNQERQKLEEELRSAITAGQRAAAGMADLEQRLIAASEHELVRLALALAARILRREVHHDPTWMDALLADVLRQVPERRRVLVRLHPRDAERLRERLVHLVVQSGVEDLQVVDDANLGPGAVILQAGGTTVDAGVASGWDRLAQRLLGACPPAVATVADEGAVTDTDDEGAAS